jgi:hypothetical protein
VRFCGFRLDPRLVRAALPRAAVLALLGGALAAACSDSGQPQRPSGSGGSAAEASAGNDSGASTDDAAIGDASTDGGATEMPDASVSDVGSLDAAVDAPVDSSDARATLVDASVEASDARANAFADAVAEAIVNSPSDAPADLTLTADALNAVDATVDAPVAVQDAPITNACPLLIDDMESGSGHANDGCRNGFWFTYNSGADAGVQTPVAGGTFNPDQLVTPRGTSHFAAHTTGSGYVFAGMGLNFASPPAGVTSTYDATGYAGITFFAMGSGAVTVMVPDRDTDPSGGVCSTADRALCNDHFSRNIVLTSTWQSYTVLFSDLLQQGFGYAPPGGFDKSAVYGVLWQASGTGTFDIWVDDLSFVGPDAGTD